MATSQEQSKEMIMLKPVSLLLLRMGTGFLLSIWGLIKVAAPEASIGVSEKYYGGVLSVEMLQVPLGALQILLGLAVVFGLFRKIAYPVQSIVLGLGLLAIWKYIADPLGMYLLTEETREVLFFPSLTVFAATLVLLAFREEDTISLDKRLGR
ncbi:MAG: hypothetical protein CML99_16330 [Rhodobiaceae bacterium]|nr:hypothetical protein [Rhodobiaceae bacterium]|tara:strand:- start:113 stop:571 length:459 start_codon:yes stop_codon:yes gene_type:complete